MAYKALYRTYRPADFEEIAGQEHITKTFKNALKNNKIAHAYLFSGPRGTGKTSIAKIIAKAVNCEKAPIENPCNECDVCRGIENNTISDVIEIDAASNNGVDEIREIRDKVKYLPGIATYKVYIIDEVHMLSTGAFNALLKTLEEPPKHVIFILATTEPHKIPATIHSRCQRFDFRGVSIPEMTGRLHTIIDEEDIDISKEAIKVIAESAEGGMRDAISLLDQVVSYTDKKVTVDDVHAIKGTVSNEKLVDVAKAIYNNDSVQAIKLLDELIHLGKEAPRLVENMIKFYRDMLVYKNTNIDEDDQLIYSNKTFLELANQLSNNMIFFYIDVLNKTQNDMKWTNNAKLFMELALIKMVDRVEKQEIIFEDEMRELRDQLESLKLEMDQKAFAPVVEPQEEPNDTEPQLDFPSFVEPQEDSVDEPEEDDPVSLDTPEEAQDEPVETTEPEEEGTTDLFSLQPEEPQKKEDTESEEPYKTYDVRYVEKVLNNGDREAKIRMNKKWFDIERYTSPELMTYAKWITTGRVVATNGEMMIIQYSNASLCNRMMRPDVKEIVVKMLSDFYDTPIDYVALPTDVWEQKSQEFIKKWKQDKEAYIKLTPIEHPALKEIPKFNKEMSEFTPDSVKDAINLFGSDAVRVKKGDK
ncbi:DNA polymerase III subunit gamma/tau [Candidatus Xianfuyuplasma coldseepsis]|uniref:DNA polymerase III subunit gamma/tau n=1 Tax=Candidatus Xianfuyuplasma coldseepsis TaxID=2782163 RepID=A0A7L7KRT6_9MOLU|nr:DNA polymerase III subunit gamma/tau [Xianfuyuplasma coldseepsis]QMS84972.1 DNA polymerase III subunit gamma/tau [Xianfuyuplasma coldseepsis]